MNEPHPVPAPDIRFMIAQAIKAPSGHNTQPWLFEVDGNRVEIHPDLRKALPVVDPDNRELFISLGCAAENFIQAAAARGYEAGMSLSEQGVIGFELSRMEEPGDNGPVMEWIDRRQTNRKTFDGRTIPDSVEKSLKRKKPDPGVALRIYGRESKEFSLLSKYIGKGNRVQMRDSAFVEELKSWMRFNRKHAVSEKDGLSYAVFGAPNLPRRIAEKVMGSFLKPGIQNKSDRKRLESASHLVLFILASNDIADWVRLGRSLQRFLLETTGLGLAHSYFNQPCEVAELAVGLSRELQLDGEHPVILLRLGYARPAPYSSRREVTL